MEILKQSPYRPLLIEQQILLLYGAMNGFYDGIAVAKVLHREHLSILHSSVYDLSLIHLVNDSSNELVFNFLKYYFDLINLYFMGSGLTA